MVLGLVLLAAFYTWRFTVWAAQAGGYWNLLSGRTIPAKSSVQDTASMASAALQSSQSVCSLTSPLLSSQYSFPSMQSDESQGRDETDELGNKGTSRKSRIRKCRRRYPISNLPPGKLTRYQASRTLCCYPTFDRPFGSQPRRTGSEGVGNAQGSSRCWRRNSSKAGSWCPGRHRRSPLGLDGRTDRAAR